MIFIFLGPPGSGKGTQADLLVQKQGFQHFSTGDMLRAECAKGTEIGNLIKQTLSEGKLVSDDIILSLLENICNDVQGHMIFDGFPRTLNQAIAFDRQLSIKNHKIDAVIDFYLPTDLLVGRIVGRFSCKKCSSVYHDKNKPTRTPGVCDVCLSTEFIRRSDDREEVVKTRLDAYERDTTPLREYYGKQNILITIDASLDIETVQNELLEKISNLGK